MKKKEFHNGIDIAAPIGTEVRICADGRVIETGVSTGYGLYMKAELTNGLTIMYAHLSETLVNEDERIKKNQIVALSGNTGLSTGAHLHYSIWKDGELTNPMPYVNLEYTNEVRNEYLARGEPLA